MVVIEVKDLKPGMKLVKDVILPDGRLLLLAGFYIKPLYIRKLEAFSVKTVYVEEVPLNPVEEYSEDKLYSEATSTIKKVFAFVRDGKNINLKEVQGTVDEIVKKVISHETVMLQLTGIRDIDNYTYLHSVDVCIYSVIIGKKLGFSNQELIELGIGAILHDIGKCKISTDILQKPAKLSEDEFDKMKRHPRFGSDILSSSYSLDAKVSNIALQHHEKWNGSGYPLGIKGEGIDLYSRIVTLADIYDALTADRVYKKKTLPHLAARFIKENSAVLFDPRLAELFIANIAIYAAGTMVLLNSGELGSVVSPGNNITSRQVVRVIAKKWGPPLLEPYELDLTDSPEIDIVEVFS